MTRPETAALNMPVLKVIPFHESKRGRPTLTETIFIRVYETILTCAAMQISFPLAL